MASHHVRVVSVVLWKAYVNVNPQVLMNVNVNVYPQVLQTRQADGRTSLLPLVRGSQVTGYSAVCLLCCTLRDCSAALKAFPCAAPWSAAGAGAVEVSS